MAARETNKQMWTPNLASGSGPLYRRLVDALADAIINGDLAIGEQLPPQRQLAWHLNINLSTVTKAFAEAKKRHLISGEVGRGTYILAQSNEAGLYELKRSGPSEVIDLSTHVPAYKTPDLQLDKTISEISAEQGGLSAQLCYQSPQQLKRIAIASSNWLEQLGYTVPYQLCVATTTAQNALLVTLLACCRRDDWVLVDEMTFPGMKTVAKQVGLKLYGVKADEQGLLPAELDRAIRSCGARVLVSDPLLQNPTASCMGAARVEEISAVIKKHQLLFIEEHVIGALSGSAPVSTAASDNALAIFSFAKAVSPGIRFAVIAGKHPLMTELSKEVYATSWQLSPLMAEVACRWIEQGIAESRRQWQRREIAARSRIFASVFPSLAAAGATFNSPHRWLSVTENPESAAASLAELGLNVVPASMFAVGRHWPQKIRLSLTAARSRQELKRGLAILRDSQLLAM